MSAWAYYNENDPHAAEWLRNLIAAGHIAPGYVDDRSIRDVQPIDLAGFRQVHLFAGISGWSYALRLAGWPDDRPVWTGSCPCQPFSVAGRGLGIADERHLWPEFHRLVAEQRPSTVFGEQVGGKAGFEWLAGVRADLERSGYAVGAASLPAGAVGAPHRRERLFWVADAESLGWRRWSDNEDEGRRKFASADSDARSLVDASRSRGRDGNAVANGRHPEPRGPSEVNFWSDAEWFTGADGKTRRIGSGVRLLVDGIPARVAKLRGLGNAIVPQVAAAFIEAAMNFVQHSV